MSSKLILLVEDNLTNQKIISKQLESLGYRVETVADGQTAVLAVAQKRYDLILMDCHLPEMDGFEATIAIRQQEQVAFAHASELNDALSNTLPQTDFQPATIVAMTASDLPQDQERAIVAGMNDYIQKPVQREMLEAVIERWMQKLEKPDSPEFRVPKSSPQPNQETDLLSSEANPSEANLDLHYLRQLSDDCPEFELELLQIFLQDSHDHLVILRQAIEQQNYRLAEQAAHHLHGSSANIGAKSIQVAAVELEQQAQQQQFQSIEFLLETIAASLRHIQAYVGGSSSKTQ